MHPRLSVAGRRRQGRGPPLGPVVEIDGEPFQVVLLEVADKAP